jgi:hypothetical protein
VFISEGNGFGGGGHLTVDGADAFVPQDHDQSKAGWLPLSDIHASLDPATGNMVVQDREPLSKFTDASNTAYESAGVELDRTWTTNSQGRVANLVDTWRSTDGNPHALHIEYVSDADRSGSGNTLDLPGSSGYSDYSAGDPGLGTPPDSRTLPSGPATIYFKWNEATPDSGDGTNPQAAMTYETAPDGPLVITAADGSSIGWMLPYERTLTANGSATLRFSWAQAFSQSDLQAFAQQAITNWNPPPQQQGNPPAPSPHGGTPPPHQLNLPATLSLIGGLKNKGNALSFTLACTNGPCDGSATLTTTELLKGSKVVHVARTKHKKVTVGKTRFTIASGSRKTITVKLNSAGKKLLKKFKKLPAKLGVTLNGRQAVAKTATFKATKRGH